MGREFIFPESINRNFDDAKIGRLRSAKSKKIGLNIAKIRTEELLF